MKDARKVKDDEGSLPTGPGDQIPSAPSPADLGRQGEEEAAREELEGILPGVWEKKSD